MKWGVGGKEDFFLGKDRYNWVIDWIFWYVHSLSSSYFQSFGFAINSVVEYSRKL
jgi:hypothetical protein